MLNVSSWGNLSAKHTLIGLQNRCEMGALLTNHQPGLPYGMGRSYGDVCLNPGKTLWRSRDLDRFINFDTKTGILQCEAGVLLQDIQRMTINQGWLLPVTPGTQLITVGGAIANDVHGKNHHRMGTFSRHVKKMTLLRADNTIIHCGPQLNSNWFAASAGGLGLTGLITRAELQLRPVQGPWLNTETIAYSSLDAFYDLAESTETNWEYSVSWIDCSTKNHRGIFMRANHSPMNTQKITHKKSLAVPLTPPITLINRYSVRGFNSLYFHLKKRKQNHTLMHYEPFLYPLDRFLQWNRIYGRKGFYQYQAVIPKNASKNAIKTMLEIIAYYAQGSFLSVLKTFGTPASMGMLSFPQPGTTLALDFANKGKKTLMLFKDLDTIVGEAGGRIYPAKDACMSAALFKMGYPQLSTFLNYRDPGICSALSQRLMEQ